MVPCTPPSPLAGFMLGQRQRKGYRAQGVTPSCSGVSMMIFSESAMRVCSMVFSVDELALGSKKE